MNDNVQFKIKRGPESWMYIYTTLGFTLTIEGTIFSILPFCWLYRLLVLFVVFLLTIYLFLKSGWLQNKLILLKIKMENSFN